MPTGPIRRADISLGLYLEQDIPAWIEVDGQHCQFVGIVGRSPAGLPRAAADEFVIEPGLLYRADIDLDV
jgi:hypothetical protein